MPPCAAPARSATVMAEEIGADRAVAWRHGLQIWVGVGARREEARVHVASAMQGFYKTDFEPFERYTPYGTADDIAQFLLPYVEAGASTFNLTPCGPDPATEIAVVADVKRLLRGHTEAADGGAIGE